MEKIEASGANREAPAAEGSQALLTAFTTEHFTLARARSQTVSESGGRSSMYLFSVSSTLIALGFVTQTSGGGSVFQAPTSSQAIPEELQREYSAEARRRWEVVKADELARKARPIAVRAAQEGRPGCAQARCGYPPPPGRHRARDRACRAACAPVDAYEHAHSHPVIYLR